MSAKKTDMQPTSPFPGQIRHFEELLVGAMAKSGAALTLELGKVAGKFRSATCLEFSINTSVFDLMIRNTESKAGEHSTIALPSIAAVYAEAEFDEPTVEKDVSLLEHAVVSFDLSVMNWLAECWSKAAPERPGAAYVHIQGDPRVLDMSTRKSTTEVEFIRSVKERR